jgi:hypothetical protein
MYEWMFIYGGRVSHALSTATGRPSAAECGVYGNWHGTGSQKERDKAAELPKCKRCTIKINMR